MAGIKINSRVKGKNFKNGANWMDRYIGDLNKTNFFRTLAVDKVSDLSLTEVEPKRRDKHGGYRYLVTQKAGSHTAFNTKRGLEKYLKDRRLDVGEKQWMGNALKGGYEIHHVSGSQNVLDKFGKASGIKPIKVLSNGFYTRGWITTSGPTKIYQMNPNYPSKKYKHIHP